VREFAGDQVECQHECILIVFVQDVVYGAALPHATVDLGVLLQGKRDHSVRESGGREGRDLGSSAHAGIIRLGVAK